MDGVNKVPLIYLPALHPELVSNTLLQSLPDEVFFMDPGLEEKKDDSHKKYISPNLVYNPKQAKVCLNDLINLEIDAGELSMSVRRKLINNFWGVFSEFESNDLKGFVEKGGVFEPKADAKIDKLRREVHEQAQKNLLLAWSQEDNILVIAELLKKLGHSSSLLAENLGDSIAEGTKKGSGDASIDGMVELITQEIGITEHDLQVQWAAALTGALCLTQPDTFFYTNLYDLNRLLEEIYSDEEGKPNIQDLDAQLAKEILPEGSLTQKFKLCEIPLELFLSVYTSPLLHRLAVLDEGKRKNITFIFSAESSV